jgi:hypothetical protein
VPVESYVTNLSPTCNGKPPWSIKAFVPTVHKVEHHNAVSTRIFADTFPEKHLHEWTKKALITLEEATEAYMVEIIAESHC